MSKLEKTIVATVILFTIGLVIYGIATLGYPLKELLSTFWQDIWIWGPFVTALIDGFVLGCLYGNKKSDRISEDAERTIQEVWTEKEMWKARAYERI